MPGTPIMAVPSRFTSAMPPIEANPLTGTSVEVSGEIREPGDARLKVLRMMTGIPSRIAGVIVAGWITLAPK